MHAREPSIPWTDRPFKRNIVFAHDKETSVLFKCNTCYIILYCHKCQWAHTCICYNIDIGALYVGETKGVVSAFTDGEIEGLVGGAFTGDAPVDGALGTGAVVDATLRNTAARRNKETSSKAQSQGHDQERRAKLALNSKVVPALDANAESTLSTQYLAYALNDNLCLFYQWKNSFSRVVPKYRGAAMFLKGVPWVRYHGTCQGNGKPAKEYDSWRWKPSECELPRFDGKKFLELTRGKTLAFIGDSVARNHMESIMFLLWQEEDVGLCNINICLDYSKHPSWVGHFVVANLSAWEAEKKLWKDSRTGSRTEAVES
ncbi:hypothetical protein ACFE04_013945 [Oxalis oulophora]